MVANWYSQQRKADCGGAIMTPRELARNECANCNPDGTCLGMDIDAGGCMKPLWDKAPKRCVILDGMPCRCFEGCLLAGIPAISNPKKANEWRKAEEEYERNKSRHNQGSVERNGNGGPVGGDSRSTANDDPGRRGAGDPIATRNVRLFGPGRIDLARDKEVQSRLIRSRS
jgi:hypothetical protein